MSGRSLLKSHKSPPCTIGQLRRGACREVEQRFRSFATGPEDTQKDIQVHPKLIVGLCGPSLCGSSIASSHFSITIVTSDCAATSQKTVVPVPASSIPELKQPLLAD